MIKTYKVRLEPNNKQHARMLQFAGAARYAYNWALAQEKEAYELGNDFISDNELRKLFTKHKADNTWLYTISNAVTAQAIKDAVIAYSNFFKGRAKLPRFKTKKKSRIPIVETYLNSRITFDGIHWYVSVGVEVAGKSIKPINAGVGIDLGIKDLAVCSDGHTYSNINKTDKVKRLEKSKHRKQRQISRKYELNKQGNKYVKTKNIAKAEVSLLKLTHKLTNIRKNYIHQVTTEIVKREPSFIVIEDLNVTGMMNNKHLSKAIQQQNLAEFVNTLTYKAGQNNIEIVYADRFYPSSKLCSNCGTVKQDLKLKDRVFKCNSCELEIDRDYNASLNLFRLGVHTASSTGINVCGVSEQTGLAKAKQDTTKQKSNINLSNRFYKI